MPNVYMQFEEFQTLYVKYKKDKYKKLLKKLKKDMEIIQSCPVEMSRIHDLMSDGIVKHTGYDFALTDLGHTLYSAVCNQPMRLGHESYSDRFSKPAA